MTDQDNANGNDDLFTTETAGLPEVLRPVVTRLGDGDRLDLRIGPVRKNIDGAELRMLGYNGSIPGPVLHVDQGSQITVQVRTTAMSRRPCTGTACGWRTATTGFPHETQARPGRRDVHLPAPVPDAGFYWYHPHIREDFGLEMGLYATIVVEPPTRDTGLPPTGSYPDPGRPAGRGRAHRAVQQVGADVRRDGPVRQRDADQRRTGFSARRQ